VLIALFFALSLGDPGGTPAPPPAEAPAPPAAQQPVSPFAPGVLRQPAPKDAPAPQTRFVWRNHPSLRVGDVIRLDFGMKVQEDWRDPGDEPDPAEFETWELHRLRAGVDGELFDNRIQFSVEREFSERDNLESSGRPQKSQWKDVWIEANISNAIQMRFGKFKIPYGLDQTSGESNLDFINRSGGGDYLSPGRDIGAMVHGRFFRRRLNYEVGGFKQDGDNSRSRRIAGGDTTFAGRVTVQPFKEDSTNGEAEIGGSFASTEVSDESLLPNGLRGRTVMSEFTFFDPVFVKGTRTRWGTDIDWTKGPAGARAEYMHVIDERVDQGLGDQDLPNARYRAYYVLGTWVLTGEPKTRPVEARRNGLGRGGLGALEVAARFDRLWFDSAKGTDQPFRNSRAETILPSGDKVWTLGLTYYANQFIKIQLNGIREQVEDAERSPTLSDKPFWSTILRFQFEL
jgi:phosphate-selective porin OprO/OprP